MLQNNTNYLVEFTQNNAKEIMNNYENYIGRLVQNKESGIEINYLEFENKKDGSVMKFSLHQIKPLPKVTYSYIDGKEPKIDTRLQSRCVAINEDNALKRKRQIIEMPEQDSSSIDEEDDQSQEPIQEKHVGWRGHTQRDIELQKMIIKILTDYPSGNISPSEVRVQMNKMGQHPVQKFVKDYMQQICEPSNQRNNRKYILLQRYRFVTDKKRQSK